MVPHIPCAVYCLYTQRTKRKKRTITMVRMVEERTTYWPTRMSGGWSVVQHEFYALVNKIVNPTGGESFLRKQDLINKLVYHSSSRIQKQL